MLLLMFFFMCLLCFEEHSLIFQNFLLVLLADTPQCQVVSVGLVQAVGKEEEYENSCC